MKIFQIKNWMGAQWSCVSTVKIGQQKSRHTCPARQPQLACKSTNCPFKCTMQLPYRNAIIPHLSEKHFSLRSHLNPATPQHLFYVFLHTPAGAQSLRACAFSRTYTHTHTHARTSKLASMQYVRMHTHTYAHAYTLLHKIRP